MTHWAADFLRQFSEARLDEPLSRYTTFRIGGPADAYIELKDRQTLAQAAAFCRARAVALTPLGFGSNVLILDAGVRGVVFRLRGDFETVDFLAGRQVRAGAGVRLPQLVALCAERGLAGIEPLAGVPGTVGGALLMNAGTRDVEIGSLVAEVEVFETSQAAPRVVEKENLHFEYRRSNLDGLVVLSGLLQLKPGDKADIMGRVQEFQQRRLQTQPIHTFNVGSTFKNPPGRFVAKLIEQAGLKGTAIGGARISSLHANFIENFSNAKADDVLRLVRRVREAIQTRFGVELELEIKVLG